MQTPGIERRHAATGFAVAVGGEELPTVAWAIVGALRSPVVAVGVLIVNGNLDTADGSQPVSGSPAPSGRVTREGVGNPWSPGRTPLSIVQCLPDTSN